MKTKRLNPKIFKIDKRIKDGYYSDAYFNLTKKVLDEISKKDFSLMLNKVTKVLEDNGYLDVYKKLSLDTIMWPDIGNLEVCMQIFQRNNGAVVCGTDEAIGFLKECAGEYVDGKWINRYKNLKVKALHDGDIVKNNDELLQPWETVMHIEGTYRYFAHLETVYLGCLARRTKIASNVYKVVKAANGVSVLFFPARFDDYHVETGDGYAYTIGCKSAGATFPYATSTDANAEWWGSKGVGTIPHALIASLGLGSTVTASLVSALFMAPGAKRIALVDFDNDCVHTSLAVAKAMKKVREELLKLGLEEEAEKFKLYGVRLDTSGYLRDKSVDPAEDVFGVCPQLVMNVRKALDYDGFHDVVIGVSGGFTDEKIKKFQKLDLPVGFYGVGSSLFAGNFDYTADIVRVKINGQWQDLSKVGRKYKYNDKMEVVR